MNSPAAAPTGASETRGFRRSNIVWIAAVYSITGIAEATSNYIMPDAIHRHTANAFLISVVLSLNPLFGFVAQPWAGWYSDRIWTPLGRRMPLIVLGVVGLVLSCLGLPFSQAIADRIRWLGPAIRWLGHPDISVGLAVLSFWILIYQFVVDVISIMTKCLVADIVPPRYRGQAFGAAQVVMVGMVFFTLRFGGAIAKGRELHWYVLVAAIALVVTLAATFLLKEPYVERKTNAAGKLRDYIETIRQTPYFFRMCLVVAFTFVAGQLITNYYRLFTKEQLGLNLEEALKAFSWMPVISFFASFPVGWLSDRVSPKYVMQAGALLMGAAGLCGVFANSIWDLRIMAILVGFALVGIEIAGNSYLISFMPRGRIGQLSGFANIFRGGPRFLMFFGAGALIEIFDRNYRVAFGGAVLCAVVAVVLLVNLPKEGGMQGGSSPTET